VRVFLIAVNLPLMLLPLLTNSVVALPLQFLWLVFGII